MRHCKIFDTRYRFDGMLLEDCAKWLQKAPESIAVNREYPAALDIHSKEDDMVLLCRTLNTGAGDTKLQYFPVLTVDTVKTMQISHGTKFDEALQNYQRQRMQDRRPDRSKGTQYDE